MYVETRGFVYLEIWISLLPMLAYNRCHVCIKQNLLEHIYVIVGGIVIKALLSAALPATTQFSQSVVCVV